MTRRKSRTLTSDWQEPNAKRPKTKQSETQEDRKLMTGSEPMTRQRKKALETAAATDCSSVASRQSSDPAVSSEVIASSEKNESARKQRQRAAMVETTGEDKEDQQDAKEKEILKDEAHAMEMEPTVAQSEGLVVNELPKRQRKKTMKGLELEIMLRRSSVQDSPATASESYSLSTDNTEKQGMEELLAQQGRKASDDSVADNTCDGFVDSSLWEVFRAVVECQTRDGRLISLAFLKLPSKKDYPDYYDIIPNPLSLNKIKERIKSGYYENLDHLCEDLTLVFTNAHRYNEPNSQIYRDAKRLLQIVKKKQSELCEDKDIESASSPGDRALSSSNISESQDSSSSDDEESEDESEDELNKQLLSLYEAVSLQKDEYDRSLCELFLTLPRAEDYPDYYDVVKHPIDMTTIRERIEKQQYASEAHCVADFELMFSNARLYNEEDSQLHQDAITLIRLVKRWLRRHQREGQTRNTTQRQELVYGDTPPQYTLGNVEYLLSIDVATCLGMTRGELYKQYPDVPRRLASYDEKKQLVAKGCASVSGQVALLQAMDVEQIMMQEEAKKNTVSVCYNVDVPTISEKVTWCFRFLPEQLVLHLAIPSQSIPLATPLNTPNKETPKPSRDSLRMQYCLLETLKACCDQSGRQVATLFLELPSKHQYPDYYQIIKKPIDIKKIGNKIRSQQYWNVDDMLSDIILMCDNACRYNELGSEVYMDSQTLLQLALRTRAELIGASRLDIYQDVDTELHRLLRSLLQSVTCYETDTGRRPSDSLIPLSETLIPLSTLDDVSQLLDRSGYQLLDEFQQDLFAVLWYAQKNHRPDSQIYEDAVLLEQVYLTERDRLCVGGVKWSSPALNYQLNQFLEEIANKEQKQLQQETVIDEQINLESESASQQLSTDFRIGDIDCHIGDTVCIMNDDQTTSFLFYIQKMWKNNGLFLDGHRFYLPSEIVLETERKFVEKEVLLSHESEVRSVQRLHKVYVMTNKQYFTHQPQRFCHDDLYFCESTYSKQTHIIRAFKVSLLVNPVLQLTVYCVRHGLAHHHQNLIWK